MTDASAKDLLYHTAEIVAAHVGTNALEIDQLPDLIAQVHRTLADLTGAAPAEEKPAPAVPINKSVQPDHIVCLEDGKKQKMLKRHLRIAHGMAPDEYRRRWGLPVDYPMTAPEYAARRSELAKKIGLGRKPGKRGRKKG